MTGFHQAAARGLHPVRAWMTQRQRLEVVVHAFLTSLQRKAGPGAGRLPRPVPLLEEELGTASAGGGPVPNLQTKRALQAKPAISPGISNQNNP